MIYVRFDDVVYCITSNNSKFLWKNVFKSGLKLASTESKGGYPLSACVTKDKFLWLRFLKLHQALILRISRAAVNTTK